MVSSSTTSSSSFLLRSISFAALLLAAAAGSMPFIREEDLAGYIPEGSAGEWISISKDTEFMPNTNLNRMPPPRFTRGRRKLDEDEEEETTTGAWEEYDPYSVQPYVDGMSEYDEYQQAWRMLGFMIDCNTVVDDDGGSGSGSDEDATEDGCARYVLWAAYVDLDYEGGGIGEYQYWDRDSQSWNDTACYYADGDRRRLENDDANDDGGYKSRCAKMDCHLEDTTFNILGFFKHRNYDDWMEQLFKHEGMCVWTEEEYAFMKGARKAWPQGCIDSGLTTGNNDEGESYNLYYNIKPMKYGRISFGLYTDSQCLDDYPVSSTDELESMVGNFFAEADASGSQDENYDFSGDTLQESMDRWNSAFDVWQMCHPCVAYDIENLDGTKYLYNDDDGGGDDGGRRKLGGEYDAEGDVFECYDDAGYTNVNQCMKFSAKTVMKTATFRDLSLGRHQSSLVEYPLSGFLTERGTYRSATMANIWTYFFFSIVSLCLLCTVFDLCMQCKLRRAAKKGGDKKDPLLDEEDQEKK